MSNNNKTNSKGGGLQYYGQPASPYGSMYNQMQYGTPMGMDPYAKGQADAMAAEKEKERLEEEAERLEKEEELRVETRDAQQATVEADQARMQAMGQGMMPQQMTQPMMPQYSQGYGYDPYSQSYSYGMDPYTMGYDPYSQGYGYNPYSGYGNGSYGSQYLNMYPQTNSMWGRAKNYLSGVYNAVVRGGSNDDEEEQDKNKYPVLYSENN